MTALAPVLLTFGGLGGSEPTKPTLILVDNADGTGFTAHLSGFDIGTVNELFVGQTSWTSFGTSFDSNGQLEVDVVDGCWFAYVVSCNDFQCVLTDVEPVTVTGTPVPAATDNVRVAVRTMKATGVYWGVKGLDKFGDPTYEEPIEITLRWEDAEEEFINANGEKEMSRSMLIVDRDLEIKGYMFLGKIADLKDTDSPRENRDAWEIRMVKNTPDFKGRKFLREAIL